jgi:hypothetical protein
MKIDINAIQNELSDLVCPYCGVSPLIEVSSDNNTYKIHIPESCCDSFNQIATERFNALIKEAVRNNINNIFNQA